MKRPREVDNVFLFKLSCDENDFNETLGYILDLENRIKNALFQLEESRYVWEECFEDWVHCPIELALVELSNED